MSITIHRWPTKENKLPFSVSSKETKLLFSILFSVYIYTYRIYVHILYYSIYIYIYLYVYICIYIYIYIFIYVLCCRFTKKIKWKRKNQVIFLNPFTVCSSCKRKFVVCPLVEETNGSCSFTNGLNRLAHLLLLIP
jgi:hypothetical protein